MATCAGLAVAGEAPGLGRQPGVVAPGWGWHRSGHPRAGAEREGQAEDTGGCWPCCAPSPAGTGPCAPGSGVPRWPRATVMSTPSQARVRSLESPSPPKLVRSPRIRSPSGRCRSAGGCKWDPRRVVPALGTPQSLPTPRWDPAGPAARPVLGAPRWLQARGQKPSLMSPPRFPPRFTRVGGGTELWGGPEPPGPAALPPGAAESEETGEPGLEPA